MTGATELRTLTIPETKAVYDTIYREAFPPMELRPFASIREMTAAGEYRTLGCCEAGRARAYASLWDAGNGFTLLDYLAVPRDSRGQGGGSAMLSALKEQMGQQEILMIESEAPTGDPAADEPILRRLQFYRRCGAREAGFDAGVFGVRYRMLYLSRGKKPDGAELLRRYRALYRSRCSEALWKRAFRIPLQPGESAPAYQEWIEEVRREKA